MPNTANEHGERKGNKEHAEFPIHEAAAKNDLKKLQSLLAGFDTPESKQLILSRKDRLGQTALHVAFKSGSYDAFTLLMNGSDINAQDAEGNTVLHFAWRENRADIANRIQEVEPIKPDIKNKVGKTPLHFAVEEMDESKENLKNQLKLFSVGVFSNEGYTPFHTAIKLKKTVLIKAFIEEQPHLKEQMTRNGEPPLWVALKHGHTDVMQLLLGVGCNVNKKHDKIKASTIWLAIYKQNIIAINLLLECDKFDCASIIEPAQDGTSALILAMIKGSRQQVDQLISKAGKVENASIIAQKLKLAFEKKRQCSTETQNDAEDSNNSAGCLTNMAVCRKLTDFPRFSEDLEDLHDTYSKSEANQPWLNSDIVRRDDVILYEDLKKHILPKVSINWPSSECLKKDESGFPINIPTLSGTKIHSIKLGDDLNTEMVKSFLKVLFEVEAYLRKRDPLFKNLGVCLLPVGSTVEGTKVGKMNELDVVFFCTELHGSLTVLNEKSILISKAKYDELGWNEKNLFNQQTGELNITKFFITFMLSIQKAVQEIARSGKIPKNIMLFPVSKKCGEPRCIKNSGKEWMQCCHQEEIPCVCYTAVGAGLNFIWKGETMDTINMLFTIDIVPNFYVNLKQLSNFSLRQMVIKYLLEETPNGWSEFLKKYIRDDRIYMGQFDFEEKEIAAVGIKMINSNGDFVIRPGLNMHVQEMMKDPIVHEAYCVLKILKTITGNKVKSFDLKKVISDQLKTQERKPDNVFAFVTQVLNNSDMVGKFDGLCKSLNLHNKKYYRIDLVEFPVIRNGEFAIYLISTAAFKLLSAILEENLLDFHHQLNNIGSQVKNLKLHGKSLLHFATEALKVEMIQKCLHIGFSSDLQDLNGNTPLHCLILQRQQSMQVMNYVISITNFFGDLDCLMTYGLILDSLRKEAYIIKLLLKHARTTQIQNKSKQTIFHLLALSGIDADIEGLIMSTATKDILNLQDKTGSSALSIACVQNNKHLATLMLSKEAEVNGINIFGTTPLILAIQSGHLEVVKLLIDNGAKISNATTFEINPLHIASVNGNLEIVKLLVNSNANVNQTGGKGNTALSLASSNGHFDVAKYLIECNAEVNRATNEIFIPLNLAAENGHTDIVRLLIESKADVNRASTDFGQTSLFAAAKMGHLEIIKLLVKANANVNQRRSFDDVTPLSIASKFGHLNVVKFLIDNKANVNCDSPLFTASEKGQLEVVRLLIENKANVNYVSPKDGATPLVIASEHGHFEIVRLLIESKANINAFPANGATSLYMAAQNGHLDVVKFLLENNADIDQPAEDGSTALFMASQHVHLKVAVLLIENKANVNHVSKGGITALCVASEKGNLAMVNLLLQSGAFVNHATIHGATALFVACHHGHGQVAKHLLQHKADINKGPVIMGKRFTPLWPACISGQLSVVKMLLLNGANVGIIHVDVARRHWHWDIVKHLVEKICKAELVEVSFRMIWLFTSLKKQGFLSSEMFKKSNDGGGAI